jgi:hypothetical protein
MFAFSRFVTRDSLQHHINPHLTFGINHKIINLPACPVILECFSVRASLCVLLVEPAADEEI